MPGTTRPLPSQPRHKARPRGAANGGHSMTRRSTAGLCAAFLLGACASAAPERPLMERIANATPAVTVTARGETTPVGTPNADAADDPAIWRNAADPAQSLIVGTDKKA